MFDNLRTKILYKTIKIERGSPILLNKIPFVMFPARSMAKFLQAIGNDCGEEFLFDLGFKGGIMVAEEFVEKLGWLNRALAKRIYDIFKMFEVMGFGKIDIKAWDAKTSKMLLHLTNHPVINHAVKLYGDNEIVCNLYRGIFSAHAHHELGIKNCHFIETQCLKKNHKFCEWSYNYFKSK
jgi:predicted hydrocarbon binding protein